MIRVLLADDHLLVRQGLCTMLQDSPGIEVIGQATNGCEAVQQADAFEPDIVLMDIRMPDMDGLEATRQIIEGHPNTAVVMLTIHDSEAFVIESLHAGAAGYVTKDCSRELLDHAIHAAVEGGALVEAGLLRRAVDGLLHPGGNRAISASLGARLTERELEVLRLLAQGHDNRTICSELFLAEVTVKKHVHNIISKLEVSDRTQAAILGVRLVLDR